MTNPLFDPRFTAMRLQEAREVQRLAAKISAANRDGKDERTHGWAYSRARARELYAEARYLMGVTSTDQFNA